jgi:hypothetical protein
MSALTLRAIMHATKGPNLSRENPIMYEVVGLPSGLAIRIAQIDHCWQILKTVDGAKGRWTGKYARPEDVLTALEAERS